MKKILFTLMLVVGSFLTQAQDYIDIIYYSADGVSYEMIVGEDGFASSSPAQNLGCAPSSLTKGNGIRLLKDPNDATKVKVQLVQAAGTIIDLAVSIENTTGLNVLLTNPLFDGVSSFSKLNNIYIGIQNGTINGTSITF